MRQSNQLQGTFKGYALPRFAKPPSTTLHLQHKRDLLISTQTNLDPQKWMASNASKSAASEEKASKQEALINCAEHYSAPASYFLSPHMISTG